MYDINSLNIKSIYDLIDSDHFRKRPTMYLGEKSITRLYIYICMVIAYVKN